MAQYWHLEPSTGFFTGFMPRSGTNWSSQMSGWHQCFGARGILTLKSIEGQAAGAESHGYQEVMSNGYNGLDDDPGDAPSEITHIYLDEPLSQNANYGNHWNAETLQELAEACQAAGKKLAIGESMGPGTGVPPSSALFEYIEEIIDATHSTLGDDLLIMPMHYFYNGWSPEGQGSNIGSLNAWWESMKDAFPNVKFAPWLTPTCAYPDATAGCSADWIEDSLDFAKSIGWKKVYFYLNDGFDFPTGVRSALLNTGWAFVALDDNFQNGCEYDIGVD